MSVDEDFWDGSQFVPCVACGVWSYVQVILPDDKGRLFWCAHHYAANEAALTERYPDAFVWDLRFLLHEPA